MGFRLFFLAMLLSGSAQFQSSPACPSPQIFDALIGSCADPCPTEGNCQTSGYVCNPIMGTCEPQCLQTNDCYSILVSAVQTPSCVIPAQASAGYCEGTCSQSSQCPTGFSCPSGVCKPQTLPGGCGDGKITGKETCDEGAAPSPNTCSGTGQSTCPHNWSCQSGACKPNFSGAGNGQNGHCSTDCRTICAEYVNYSGSAPSWAVNNNQTTITAALANLKAVNSTAPTQTICTDNVLGVNFPGTSGAPTTTQLAQCPCGYGIWVSNGPANGETYAIQISQPMEIYGGFSPTKMETSIHDRVDPSLTPATPLGQESFSGTLLMGATSNAFQFTSGTVILDGFQILSGHDSAIVINAGVTATLQNLKISGNTATVDGGAIQNLGTMTLSDSMVTLNTAVTQGGAISHKAASGTSSTIQRTTFFGNGIGSSTVPIALCAAGGSGTCPTGMICPATGGVCTGNPTAIACSLPTINCPTGMTCTSGKCTGTPSWTLNNGGAISATGAGTLNIYASKFNANYSYGNGGAIFSQSPLNIVSSLFTANWASNGGGGLYVSKGGNAQLYNLTFVDNAAYNLGGGGIYDEGTGGGSNGSSIQSSLFRDNVGLYPVNSTGLAEWAGNRGGTTPFLYSQINSISTGVGVATSSMVIANTNTMGASYVDLCPVMAYGYGVSPTGSAAGLCDGTQTCGSISAPNPGQKPAASKSFNTNATAQNTCNRQQEFLECTLPVYRNCTPAPTMGIVDANAPPPPSGTYQLDLAGQKLPTSGAFRGAYRMQCIQDRDCSGATPSCFQGTCVQCSKNSQCSGTSDTCSNFSCVCGNTGGTCGTGQSCQGGLCPCGIGFNGNGWCSPGMQCADCGDGISECVLPGQPCSN